MRCRAHGCENDSKDGMFLGEICVPCYEALGTPAGVTYPGTDRLLSRVRTYIQRCRMNPMFVMGFCLGVLLGMAVMSILADASDSGRERE